MWSLAYGSLVAKGSNFGDCRLDGTWPRIFVFLLMPCVRAPLGRQRWAIASILNCSLVAVSVCLINPNGLWHPTAPFLICLLLLWWKAPRRRESPNTWSSTMLCGLSPGSQPYSGLLIQTRMDPQWVWEIRFIIGRIRGCRAGQLLEKAMKIERPALVHLYLTWNWRDWWAVVGK